MELMSAVRSVSCNSSMSKCNKSDDDEYGNDPPIIDSMYVKSQTECPPPPPPPAPPGSTLSCNNPDLVQVEKCAKKKK